MTDLLRTRFDPDIHARVYLVHPLSAIPEYPRRVYRTVTGPTATALLGPNVSGRGSMTDDDLSALLSELAEILRRPR